jgi:hypothetical protein
MLTRRVDYRDLGEAYLDRINHTRTANNLKRRLERLGYVVSILPKPAGQDTDPTVASKPNTDWQAKYFPADAGGRCGTRGWNDQC